MISNIKRYKSTINNVIDIIKSSNYSNKIAGYLYFDASLYMSSVYFALEFYDLSKLLVNEDKSGDVFIGLNLDKVRLDLTQVDKGVRQSVYNTVVYSNQNKSFYDDLMKDISPYSQYSISIQNSEKTEYYRKLYNAVYTLPDYADIDCFLGDKEFPTLVNRKLLPIAILKFSKGKINFSDTTYPRSYKSNRYTYNIRDFSDGNKIRNFKQYSRIPLGLISTKITGGHILRCGV